jgi:hypothetical protein
MDTQNNPMGAGESGDAPQAAPMPDDSDKNTVVLSADHFPKGIVPKSGDVLQFHVLGEPDSEGNVSGYFDSDGNPEGGTDAWEEEFKKSMSPTTPQSEAQ